MEKNSLPLKPMRRVLVSDEIIEQIKNLILDGTLKPGDRLSSETKMASQMNVGRSTIREALKVLIHLGFIERKNKVTMVAEHARGGLNPHDIVERFKKHRNLLEMIEVRKIIEPDIAGIAAARRRSEDLDMLRKDVQAMHLAMADLETFMMHDYHFHLNIAQAAGNQILIEIIGGIQNILRKTQEHILRQSDSIHPRSLEFHWKIFKAIKNGNAKSAGRHMAEHIADIESEMYVILKKKQP